MSDPNASRDNPYVGLRPFFFEDRGYFFGRDEQTTHLLETLYKERFLAVVGSSGCGKSSLVRAGLIPMLLGGFLTQDRLKWSIARMKPGDEPVANLAAALAEARDDAGSENDVADIDNIIREDHAEGVAKLVAGLIGEDRNMLILVDQFEEIFAYRKSAGDDNEELGKSKTRERARRRAEAAEFVDLLLRLSERRDLPIYIVITMRTDFLGDCDVFYGLPEAMNRGRYLVPRLTRQQLREAIHGPVLLRREKIAPRLLDRLLNELGDRSDRLPVLQHALLRTWDSWSADGGIGPIDIVHFDRAGGLDGALAQDAKGALQGLDRDLTKHIFKGLTDTDTNERRVRRPARISELMAVCEAERADIEKVVTRFNEDNRNFLYTSPDGDPDDPRVDMAHESLIRQWDDLREWVDEERISRDHFLELVERSRGGKALLVNPDLRLALNWQENAKPTRAWARRYERREDDYDVALAYLEESKTAAEVEAQRERELLEKEKRIAEEERELLRAQSERRRKAVRRVAALAVVFAGIAIFSIYQYGQIAWWQDEAGRNQQALEASTDLIATWVDDTKTDDEFREHLERIDRSLGVHEQPAWRNRVSQLDRWNESVAAVEAFDTMRVSVPEKVEKWQGLLALRSPRVGPDTDDVIETARSRIVELERILENSIRILDGTLVASATVNNNCPGGVPAESRLEEGKKACVWFNARVEGSAQRGFIVVENADGVSERDFSRISGQSYRYGPGVIDDVGPAGETEVRVENRNREIVFRQVFTVEPAR